MPLSLAALRSHLVVVSQVEEKTRGDWLDSGVEGVKLPRGGITEVVGAGKGTLASSILTLATKRQEACAVVDVADTFDPAVFDSAASDQESGGDLRYLLWVRCAAAKKNALQVVDWLLQGGGFGVIVLDLSNLTARDLNNIPLNAWFRYRRAVENKPTALVVVANEPCVGSAAALRLELRQKAALWNGLLFEGAVVEAASRKPVRAERREVRACLLA